MTEKKQKKKATLLLKAKKHNIERRMSKGECRIVLRRSTFDVLHSINNVYKTPHK